MQRFLIFTLVPLLSFTQTPCLDAVANATGLIGEFVPQCEEDGSYSPVQCWSSTGYCWCVDEYGVEIPGTSLGPGQGLPNCEGLQNNLCDSIYVDLIMYNEFENTFQIGVDIAFTTEYWFNYCGLIMIDNQGDTLAVENFNNATNMYGLGPGMSELRYLEIQQAKLEFPLNGEIHLIEGFFAGNASTACFWPFSFNAENSSHIGESLTNNSIANTFNLLGRITNEAGLYINIYDDGSVKKKYVIR